MKSLLEKVRTNIQKYELVRPGDNVVTGVSGGADSTCLLHVLFYLREELGINTLAAVHLNHMYRGQEARQDQLFTERYCEELGVQCYSYEADVVRMAKDLGISTEEAGRQARYGAFAEVLESLGGGKIAVAHNADDQAETVIMRIIRGTGPDGLAGMEYIRDEVIIRPLLSVSRAEIEGYCGEQKLKYVTDLTNLEPIYTRNAVRLQLIPKVDQWFGGDFRQSLFSLGEISREDKDFIYSFVQPLIDAAPVREGRMEFSYEELIGLHPAIRKRVLLKAFAKLGKGKDIGAVHLAEAEKLLLQGKTTSDMEFPGGCALKRRYDKVICEKVHLNDTEPYYYDLYAGVPLLVSQKNFTVVNQLIESEEEIAKIKEGWFRNAWSDLEQFFDYDKLTMPLAVRNRRGKELFSPLGFAGTKKLKEYLIDRKVDRDMRDRIPLFCQGDQVVWIVGYGINDKVKVDEKTKRILRIALRST